jgi:D-galactarolactone isomerase
MMATAICPAPEEPPVSAPATDLPCLKAPPGTTDTHVHIYDRRFPRAPTATMDPADALVPHYRAMCARIGIERTVVVQPSIYGTDNRCTMEAVAAMVPNARAVVVVDQTVTDAELDRLTKAGARGIRFHMLAGGVLPWDILETMGARVASFGWLVQLQLDGRDLPQCETLIRRVKTPLIIDHTGKFLEPVEPDHPAFLTLLRLLENGRTYVKLAAAYETSKVGPPGYDDVGKLAGTLVRAAPERILWASNWPHPTPGPFGRPSDANLLDLLLDWAPDETARRAILVDNPAQLFGFGS